MLVQALFPFWTSSALPTARPGHRLSASPRWTRRLLSYFGLKPGTPAAKQEEDMYDITEGTGQGAPVEIASLDMDETLQEGELCDDVVKHTKLTRNASGQRQDQTPDAESGNPEASEHGPQFPLRSGSVRWISSLWRFAAQARECKTDALELVPIKGRTSAEDDERHRRPSGSSLGSASVTDTVGMSEDEHRNEFGSWEYISLRNVLKDMDESEDIIRQEMDDGSEKPVSSVLCRPEKPSPHCSWADLTQVESPFENWGLGGLGTRSVGSDMKTQLSIGNRSAPGGCCAQGCVDQLEQTMLRSPSVGRRELSDDGLSDGNECIFDKGYRTMLDVFELVGELRRQEVIYRIDNEKKELLRQRKDLLSRKQEFELIKNGMYTVTPEVARLRRRWGSRRSIKCRERLARIKQLEEEELWCSIPLMA